MGAQVGSKPRSYRRLFKSRSMPMSAGRTTPLLATRQLDSSTDWLAVWRQRCWYWIPVQLIVLFSVVGVLLLKTGASDALRQMALFATPSSMHLRSALQLATTPPWASNDGVTKPYCQHYFGADTNRTGLLITVVDLDVRTGYPLGQNTMVHHSGPYSRCFSPGPPFGVHRYVKTYYSRCAALQDGPDGAHVSWTGNSDTEGRFSRTTGVLLQCAGHVVGREVTCWMPPASAPVQVDCPNTVAPGAGDEGHQRASHSD